MKQRDGLSQKAAKQDWTSKVLWTVSWVVVSISAWTSASGLRAFFGNSSGDEPWLLWPFFLLVAGAFHVISVIAFLTFRNRGLWRGLLGYIVLSAIAVLLSFGWHWWHINADAFAGQQYEQNRTEVVRALINTNEGSLHMVRTLGLLQDYSAAAAKTEAATGGTCGGEARRKAGVRHGFRTDDKEIFSALSVSAKKRQERLAKLVADAQALPATGVDTIKIVPQMTPIIDEFAALTEDDRLVADIRRQIEERLALARTGIGTENGKIVTCPDARRETLLKGVIEATRTPKITTIHVLNPLSREETQKAAWHRLVTRTMDFDDWIALGAASLVEFALFFLLTLTPRRYASMHDEFEIFDDLARVSERLNVDALRRLGQQYAGQDMEFIRLVEEHVFYDRILWYRTPMLAVPANSCRDVHKRLRIIAAVFSQCKWATRPWTPDWYFRMRLRLSWTDAPLKRLARQGELTFYKLDAKIWETILIVMAMSGRPDPNSPGPQTRGTSHPSQTYRPSGSYPLLPYFGPTGAS